MKISAIAILLAIASCARTPAGDSPTNSLTSLASDGQVSAQELLQSQRPATPILLVFWATWCPECIPDLFTLAQNRNRLPMDLTILSVNIEPGSSSEAFRQTKTMLSDSMVFATLQGESAPLSDEWLSGQEIIMPTLLYFPRAGPSPRPIPLAQEQPEAFYGRAGLLSLLNRPY